MNLQIFEQKLIENSAKIDIELTSSQIKKFYDYMQLLLEWNEKINLTAIIEPEEVITKHFIDSITIQKHIKENSHIIDVGTGAGFPGVPLKIIREDINVTLLDSLNKRIIFLKEITKKLELEKVQTMHGRAEEMGRDNCYREKYDAVVSRAVASLNSLLEYTSPLVKVNGKIICMKGPKLEEELKQSQNAIGLLGVELDKTEKIILPDTDMERNILILKKIKSTSSKYPRKALNIKKEPL